MAEPAAPYANAAALPDKATAGRPEPRALPPLGIHWNLAWVFSGNAVRSVARAVLLILLVKWAGWEAAGVYIAALALTGPIFAVTDLGLRPLLINDVAREYPFQHYFSLRLVGSAAAWGVAVVLGLVLGYSFHRVALILCAAATRFWDGASDILHGVLQREERMDRIGLSLILRHLLGVAAFCGAIHWGGTITLAAALDALAAVAVCLAWDLPNAQRLLRGLRREDDSAHTSGESADVASRKPSADTAALAEYRTHGSTVCRREALHGDRDQEHVSFVRPTPVWGSLIRHSIPLAIVAFEINLITNVPRYVVESVLGPASLAIFASLLQLAGMGMIFVVAMGQTMSPRLARYYRQGDHRGFLRLLAGVTTVSALLGVVPWMIVISGWGPLVLQWLFRDDMARHWDMAVWVMGSAVILYLTGPLGRALDTLLRFKTHVAIRTTSLVLVLLLLPPMTRLYGLWGAAVGFTIAQGVMLPLYLIAIAHAWKHRQHAPRLRRESGEELRATSYGTETSDDSTAENRRAA
ncbi:lipopolysaccharide biosynthesis protein [Thermopirellula anaerolimosa]